MRLIDSDLLLKYRTDHEMISTHLIYNAPTVDAVEVVRCKDCKWYKKNYSWNGTEHKVCVIEPYEPARKECDYCSRGERKETEDE